MAGKKLLLLGFVVVLLVVIPLTVYLVQQQQKLGVGAAPSTVLSFIPSTKSVAPGEAFTLDVNMAPGGNEVSFIKLTINYDPTKLEPNALGTSCPLNSSYVICPTSSLFPGTPLQGPTISASSVSITLSVGSNPASAIKTATKIATIGFKAKDSAGTTSVSYGSDSQVLSIANADQFNENVLLNSQPATITIAGAATSPSPVASGSTTPAASPAGATGSNKIPVCSSLALDRSATGTAPYSITFTGQGTDSDGTITKATFNFGDGTITDVTTGGGIGTNSVNVPISHTYNNPGTFSAKVTFTDNQSGVSADTANCTKQITVNAAASGGTSTTQTVTVTASASATPEATPTPVAIAEDTTKGGLPSVGPGETILGLGGLGVVAAIIGLLILIAL